MVFLMHPWTGSQFFLPIIYHFLREDYVPFFYVEDEIDEESKQRKSVNDQVAGKSVSPF